MGAALTCMPGRKDMAMSGEVTLRGRVLPIGGLKEKLIAALRGGIKMVLIPAEKEPDLAEIPANVKEGLEIIPVSNVEEVLARALTAPLHASAWIDSDDLSVMAGAAPLAEGHAALPPYCGADLDRDLDR